MMASLRTFISEHFFTRSFFRFIGSGIAVYLFNTIGTYLATEYFSQYYLLSYAVLNVISTVASFFINTHYAFLTKDKYTSRFTKYLVSVVIFYFLNVWLVKLFVEWLGIHYIISIALATGVLMLAKFLTYDKLIFHQQA